MAVLGISDELKALVDKHEQVIKNDYITRKLFVDSAVRDKLRQMGVKSVGEDAIVAHLEHLKESKRKHLSQQALIHKQKRHKNRIERLNETV